MIPLNNDISLRLIANQWTHTCVSVRQNCAYPISVDARTHTHAATGWLCDIGYYSIGLPSSEPAGSALHTVTPAGRPNAIR